MRHKKTLIILQLFAPLFLYGLFLAVVVNGDGLPGYGL